MMNNFGCTDLYCKNCGGHMEEILHGDGVQCETCGWIIRSDGSNDISEVPDEMLEVARDGKSGVESGI